MSSQSSTSSLESLNESCSTKYGLEPYMHEPTFSNKKNICYDNSEISSEDNSDDEEINTRIGNTNWCKCGGNCSKMETSTESICCREMLEISDERFNGIYNYVYFISCMICNDSLYYQFFKTVI